MRYSLLTEHTLVALRVDLPRHRLRTGDIGTVVSVQSATGAYTVEFMTLGGDTLALLTLPQDQIRAVATDEIAQARPLETAA